MKKTRLRQVYKQPGKSNIPDTTGKSGVYLIYKDFPSGRRLVYVGMSSGNLYKTILRHFQSWNDPTQQRVVYDQGKEMKIRVIFCTPKQAEKLERAIILKYRPEDNPNKLENILELDRSETNLLEKVEEAETVPF